MQQQDEHTFSNEADAALYERYAASIFAYLRLHISTMEDAEDLLIEVFTAALEQDNLSWLAEKQQFVWLRRVAQNKLSDHYRRSNRRVIKPLDEVFDTMCIEEALVPEQVVMRQKELEGLYATIARLSSLQQHILQLRVGDGLHFAEIAILVKKREDAVRKIYSRTLAQLRTHYGLK